jgi:flagellar basal-body rod protein FlgC
MPTPVDPNKGIPGIRPMFRTMGIAASGLTAQRLRMETIATNIANAETTHTAAGGPYRRRVVQMEAATADSFQKKLESAASGDDSPTKLIRAAGTNGSAAEDKLAAAEAAFEKKISQADKLSGAAAEEAEAKADSNDGEWGVRVSAITEDDTPGPLVYDPAHPDADANGYVRMPNVRITDELIDMMDAKRMYEANVTVFQAAKSMLRRSIEI